MTVTSHIGNLSITSFKKPFPKIWHCLQQIVTIRLQSTYLLVYHHNRVYYFLWVSWIWREKISFAASTLKQVKWKNENNNKHNEQTSMLEKIKKKHIKNNTNHQFRGPKKLLSIEFNFLERYFLKSVDCSSLLC